MAMPQVVAPGGGARSFDADAEPCAASLLRMTNCGVWVTRNRVELPTLDRIKALPGWKHPYDLMPGYPLPDR